MGRRLTIIYYSIKILYSSWVAQSFKERSGWSSVNEWGWDGHSAKSLVFLRRKKILTFQIQRLVSTAKPGLGWIQIFFSLLPPKYAHILLSFLQQNEPILLSSVKILIGEFEILKWFRSPWMRNVMYCASSIMCHPSLVSKLQKMWQNQYKRIWRWF